MYRNRDKKSIKVSVTILRVLMPKVKCENMFFKMKKKINR